MIHKKKDSPLPSAATNGQPLDPTAVYQKIISNHQQAAAHHTEAAKHHLDAAKSYDKGNVEKAAHSALLA